MRHDVSNTKLGEGQMSEGLGRSLSQKKVDTLDTTHRIDPLGGGQSQNDKERQDQKQQHKFKREPDPEDRVEISEEAMQALKQNQGESIEPIEPADRPALVDR
jgi:hypothetical protein